jgi:molecular chaperone DnaK
MLFIGIDLGTTNSALAAFDGETVSVIPNTLGETLTPSAVRLDGSGGVTVGRKARRFLESDPSNTRAEWKRLMGTGERLAFAASGRALLPEELSAQVLGSLLADARDALGFAPRAAVISTPALFELPQNHATVRAGTLAGLEEVVLIQEPIASAIAAGWRAEHEGTWLVFDLGGGTLDVSLLETREGRLRVIDHAGDNFLGGKDIDQALVDWAVAELGRGGEVPGLAGADPANRRARARLRVACEEAKIELSRSPRAAVVVPELAAGPGGRPVDVELVLTRDQLDLLVAPLVARSLTVVRTLLAANQRSAGDVVCAVLVGGPTLARPARARGRAVRRPHRRGGGSHDRGGAGGGAVCRHGGAGGEARAPAGDGARRAGGAHRAPPGHRGSRALRGGALLARCRRGAARAGCGSSARTPAGRAPRPRFPPRAASSCRCSWRGTGRAGSG